MNIIIQLKTIHIGEGSGRGSGRVGSDFVVGNRGSSGRVRVNVSPGRVGSGPRKVTRGQLWCVAINKCLIMNWCF